MNMAGKRKGINRKIYNLLKQSPAMPRAVVLSKLGLGEEHTVSVYRIRNEIKKQQQQPISERMQQQREIDMQVKEAVEEAAKRKSEKMAKKLRQAIEEGDADAVRSHIDFLINRLDSGEASRDMLQQVFTLFQDDLLLKERAYNMLSKHHDSCLARIADLERQNDIMFGWGYFWKWLARRVTSRKDWQ
jgi:ribosome assembly protein YihI (activator of Der GTPase)